MTVDNVQERTGVVLQRSTDDAARPGAAASAIRRPSWR